mmetsp:Transcript_38058/g.91312  ORF Transcript_38058/g.91312 Transcript_38058/m.91312 type:complete len:746 (-) Transcript_38058:45-2282(-)
MTHVPRRSSRLKQQQAFPESIPSYAASASACGACLLALEESCELATLSVCPHVFHANCLISWAEKENSCPQCKRRFSELAVYNDGVWERTTKVVDKDQDPLSDSEDALECSACGLSENPDQLLLCDGRGYTCNRAYHIYCVGLKAVPMSDWFCPRCDKSSSKKGWTCQSCGQNHARKATTKCSSCGETRDGTKRMQGRCDVPSPAEQPDLVDSMRAPQNTTVVEELADASVIACTRASLAVSDSSSKHPETTVSTDGMVGLSADSAPASRETTGKAAGGLSPTPSSTTSRPVAAVKSERPRVASESVGRRVAADDDLEVVRRGPRPSPLALPVAAQSFRPGVKAERSHVGTGQGGVPLGDGKVRKSQSSQKLHDTNFSLWSALNPRMSVGRAAPPAIRSRPQALEIVAADFSDRRPRRPAGPPAGLVPSAPGVIWAPGPSLHVRWTSAGLDDAALRSRVLALDAFLEGQRALRCRIDVAHNMLSNLDPLLDCVSRHSLVLTRLSASYNRIGDEGAHTLADWITQYDIFVCEVNLEHNEITGGGLVSVLNAFHGNPQYPGSGDEDSDSGRPVFLRLAGNRIESPSTVVGSLEDVRSTVCAGTADCEPARGVCGSGVDGVKIHLHQVLFQRPRKLDTEVDQAPAVKKPRAGARYLTAKSRERQESRMRAPRYGSVFPTVPQPSLEPKSAAVRGPATSEGRSVASASGVGSLWGASPLERPPRRIAPEALGPCGVPDDPRSKRQRTAL